MTAIIIPTWAVWVIMICMSISATLDIILFVLKRVEARELKRADALLKARSEMEE